MSEEGKRFFGRRRKSPVMGAAAQAAGDIHGGGQKTPKHPPKPLPVIPKTPLPPDPVKKVKPPTAPNEVFRALGKRGRWPNLPKG